MKERTVDQQKLVLLHIFTSSHSETCFEDMVSFRDIQNLYVLSLNRVIAEI